MKTTLNKIREHSPCTSGWEKLLKHLGKTKADDEELSILTILDSNGLDDALWCLRAVDGHDIEKRRFAIFCARQVEHLLTEQSSRDAIAVAERYCDGQATDDELADAARAPRAAYATNAYPARAAYAAAAYATCDTHAYVGGAAADAAYYAAAAARAAAARAAARAEIREAQTVELSRICELNT